MQDDPSGAPGPSAAPGTPEQPLRREPGEWLKKPSDAGKMPIGEAAKLLGPELLGEGSVAVEDAPPGTIPEPPKVQERPIRTYEFKWANNPETFNFERMVFGDGALSDECAVHDGLKIQVRSLPVSELEELDLTLVVNDPRSRTMAAADRYTILLLSKVIAGINGKRLGKDEEGVQEWLEGKADVFIQFLGQVYNEFKLRIEELARRGKVKNS